MTFDGDDSVFRKVILWILAWSGVPLALYTGVGLVVPFVLKRYGKNHLHYDEG